MRFCTLKVGIEEINLTGQVSTSEAFLDVEKELTFIVIFDTPSPLNINLIADLDLK